MKLSKALMVCKSPRMKELMSKGEDEEYEIEEEEVQKIVAPYFLFNSTFIDSKVVLDLNFEGNKEWLQGV